MSSVEGVGTTPGYDDARASHWERVHAEKRPDDVSWWQSVPSLSLGLIESAGLDLDDPVIDVGAGASTLTDHLLGCGYTDLTAIDLSATALRTLRARLGPLASTVRLEVADVLDLDLGRPFALWHDRAVFHFLTEPGERADYRASLDRSLRPGGRVVVATFGPDGPATCSGLPVVRYSPIALAGEFPGLRLVATAAEDHETPWGTTQQFTAVLLERAQTA